MTPNTNQLISSLQQFRAKENDLAFLTNNLIPIFTNAVNLEDEIVGAILTGSPDTYTIPWVFALLNIIQGLKKLDQGFVKLFHRFMESFRVDHIELIGDSFIKLINEVDSKGEAIKENSKALIICVASSLRTAVIKLNTAEAGTTRPTHPLSLTPIHTTLAYYSVLSNRGVLCKEMLDVTYTRPNYRFPISQLNILRFHYYSAIILISNSRYIQAIEYLNTAMSIPLDANSKSQALTSQITLKAYEKWILTTIIQHGAVPRMSKLINDEDQQSFKRRAKLYETVKEIYNSSQAQRHQRLVKKMEDFINKNKKELEQDETLSLVKLCVESYKTRYIKNLQKNIFSSMNIEEFFLNSFILDRNSVYDYINQLVLTKKVSPNDYKIMDDKIPFLISPAPKSTISEMNDNITKLITTIATYNNELDSISQQIILSGDYARLVQKSLRELKQRRRPQNLSEINNDMAYLSNRRSYNMYDPSTSRPRVDSSGSNQHQQRFGFGRRRTGGGKRSNGRRQQQQQQQLLQPSNPRARQAAQLFPPDSDSSSADELYDDMVHDFNDSTEN